MTIPKIVAQLMTADERRLVVLRLDRELRRRRGELGAADLGGREGLGSLDQPVGRARLDVELAHRVLGDHRVRRRRPARQGPDLLDHRVGETARGGRTAWDGARRDRRTVAACRRCVVEDETRDARETGT